MPALYAPLPDTRYALDEAQRELDDAFDSDDEGHDASESTPLTRAPPPRSDLHFRSQETASNVSGGYDFERDYDYDYPPPGSPPAPSAFALPNNFGNSNGRLPAAPVMPPQPRVPFWRRAVGALLPQHYVRVPTDAPSARIVGGGTENDGVFANVSAKPSRPITITDANGDVHFVPEEVQKEVPPSYAEAQADAVPSYWETTVHAPTAALDPNAYMIIDELPTGPVFTFIMTAFISYFFQFAGFVLTYLLHTTHAGKYGARAGLGATFIQFGLIQYSGSFRGSVGLGGETDQPISPEIALWNTTDTATSVSESTYNATDPNTALDLDIQLAITSRDWISLILMTLGWFLLLSSCVGFYRVKRWEVSIRAASLPQEPLTPEQHTRDEHVRRNIENAFGFAGLQEQPVHHNETAQQHGQGELTEEELRLTRTLQAAGLL